MGLPHVAAALCQAWQAIGGRGTLVSRVQAQMEDPEDPGLGEETLSLQQRLIMSQLCFLIYKEEIGPDNL